jgi:hypothetical protein
MGGVRIGGGSDPGHLDKLETPDWEKRLPFREMQERLEERELREKYADTNYHAAHPTKTPTAGQVAEIEEHIKNGERQEALDKTIAYYGIDTGNVNGKVTYDAGLGSRGVTDKDRNVRIGPNVFTHLGPGAAATAATVLHEVTHANQVKHHLYPSERPGWSNARINQEFAAYEAMGYQAALRHADEIGLNDEQKTWYQGKVDEYRNKLTPGNRALYDGGQYWGMK